MPAVLESFRLVQTALKGNKQASWLLGVVAVFGVVSLVKSMALSWQALVFGAVGIVGVGVLLAIMAQLTVGRGASRTTASGQRVPTLAGKLLVWWCLALFIVWTAFFTGWAFGIVRSERLDVALAVDRPGEPRDEADPANPDSSRVTTAVEQRMIDVKLSIMDHRQYLESIELPSSRQRLSRMHESAEKILGFPDSELNIRRRFVKYQYASFAYVMTAAAADHEGDGETTRKNATEAVRAADRALALLSEAREHYSSDPSAVFLVDWVQRDEGGDRVLYLKAMAQCMLIHASPDTQPASLGSFQQTWNAINAGYRARFPASVTPQLSGCVVDG